jgi:hypothetical protein
MRDHLDLQEFSRRVDHICSLVSLRRDENGPYVFALGLKGIHTLQLRRLENQYAVELWHGNADDEFIANQSYFSSAIEAFNAAEEWLQLDVA